MKFLKHVLILFLYVSILTLSKEINKFQNQKLKMNQDYYSPNKIPSPNYDIMENFNKLKTDLEVISTEFKKIKQFLNSPPPNKRNESNIK